MATTTPAQRLAEIKREQDEGEPLIVVLSNRSGVQIAHGDIDTLTDTDVVLLDGDNEPHTIPLADIGDVERVEI